MKNINMENVIKSVREELQRLDMYNFESDLQFRQTVELYVEQAKNFPESFIETAIAAIMKYNFVNRAYDTLALIIAGEKFGGTADIWTAMLELLKAKRKIDVDADDVSDALEEGYSINGAVERAIANVIEEKISDVPYVDSVELSIYDNYLDTAIEVADLELLFEDKEEIDIFFEKLEDIKEIVNKYAPDLWSRIENYIEEELKGEVKEYAMEKLKNLTDEYVVEEE